MRHCRISFIFLLCIGFFLLITARVVIANGCAGDCFSCHKGISEDITHRELGSCKECHNGRIEVKHKEGINIFKQEAMGCGNNCLECHKEFPKTKEHRVMDKCNDCHRVNLLGR